MSGPVGVISRADADFVPPPRASLYDVPSLLDGWSERDPGSYAATLDARAYLSAAVQGLRNPQHEQVAKSRALHDVSITRSLSRQLAAARPVAVMGGHEMARNDHGYRLVAECAAALTRAGFTVLSGGGPGAMEAAHLGASFANAEPSELEAALTRIASDTAALTFPLKPSELIKGGSFCPESLAALHRWQTPAFAVASGLDTRPVSIGIPTWLYGYETPTPLAYRHAKYFDNSIREDGLLAVALYGVLYAPGKAGTLQEIFQDAAQNYYSTAGDHRPMVFLDLDSSWSARFPVKPILDNLFAGTDRTFLHFVTTVKEVITAFESHAPKLERRHSRARELWNYDREADAAH